MRQQVIRQIQEDAQAGRARAPDMHVAARADGHEAAHAPRPSVAARALHRSAGLGVARTAAHACAHAVQGDQLHHLREPAPGSARRWGSARCSTRPAWCGPSILRVRGSRAHQA